MMLMNGPLVYRTVAADGKSRFEFHAFKADQPPEPRGLFAVPGARTPHVDAPR